MGSLITHHFLFTTEVITPLELDEHSSASLRGRFFDAVWSRFCNNKAAPTCATCPLHNMCPVSALVAPLREESERGRDILRPYVILPPLDARYHKPGEQLIFGITRFKIKQIESYHPVSAERKVIYQSGKPIVEVPTLSITSIDISKRATALSAERINIHFLTPTRILFSKKN